MKINSGSNVWLKVYFIGEEAQDEGGPQRKFLHLAVDELCEHSGVLQGPDSRKTISNNLLLLEQGFYYCAIITTTIFLQQGALDLTAFHMPCTITILMEQLKPHHSLMMQRTMTLT